MKLKIEDMLIYLGIKVEDETKNILNLLSKNSKVEENKLAETLGVKINAVRKLLYGLGQKSYVTYYKEKSKEKKWWYIYFWKLNKSKIQQDYIKTKIEELERKERELEKEIEYAFKCDNGCVKMKYEDALDDGFTCPQCGSPLEQIKRSNRINPIREEISKLKGELVSIKPKK